MPPNTPAYRLAMLALQSHRYVVDADYRDAVDAVLASIDPRPAPEALPTCEKCNEEITGTPVYVKGTEGVLHLNCSLRSE